MRCFGALGVAAEGAASRSPASKAWSMRGVTTRGGAKKMEEMNRWEQAVALGPIEVFSSRFASVVFVDAGAPLVFTAIQRAERGYSPRKVQQA